jgi:trans-aconitate methyltransferase
MSASLKESAVARVVSQFGRPRGLAGHAVGWIMATRDSNRGRNQWVVSLLDVQPADRVLEIGFGPGIAIAEVARRAPEGRVYGVDHSELMMRQARRRNGAAVRAGVVDLRVASIDALPEFGQPLDKIFAVNSLLFWSDPVDRLRALRGLLRAGGTIAIGHQPRCPGATAETSHQAATEISELLTEAGFSAPRVEVLDLEPPVVCVLAKR